MNFQQTLSEDKKWLSFIFSQFRFIDRSHPVQSTILEGGIGYRVYADNSLWLGYRWSGHNPNNDFYQENRLFQQFLWLSQEGKTQRIILRTRLEELQWSHQSQIALRLRQRLALQIEKAFPAKTLFPFIYDEAFFQLNNTRYTTHQFFSENRLFIGFNLRLSKKTWWEVGYMNQFQSGTPLIRENQISHILFLVFNYA